MLLIDVLLNGNPVPLYVDTGTTYRFVWISPPRNVHNPNELTLSKHVNDSLFYLHPRVTTQWTHGHAILNIFLCHVHFAQVVVADSHVHHQL